MHLAVVNASVNNASGVLAALRAATRAQHASLEATLILSQPTCGSDEYRAYAMGMYGWLAPLEQELWSAPWPSEVEVDCRRDKAIWLRDDLLALRTTAEHLSQIPACHDLPRMDTLSQRFGVAYVVEGSQLGGQVLLRKLGPALAPHVPRYLVGYGSDTGRRWRAFLAAMAEHVVADDEIATAAASAQHAFASLDRWFRNNGVA